MASFRKAPLFFRLGKKLEADGGKKIKEAFVVVLSCMHGWTNHSANIVHALVS
jgi:hypothetical protein